MSELDSNRQLWDERADIHVASDFYDVEALLQGKLSLQPLELDELGSVESLDVVHLQCHIGTDSISLARLGAQVTGVDFSQRSIEVARELAEKADMTAQVRFECCTNEEAPSRLGADFDLVYTSWGVLDWLPSITHWAEAVVKLLRPGGRVYVADQHPFSAALYIGEDGCMKELYPYGGDAHFSSEGGSTYADRTASTTTRVRHYWSHGLGDIVTALIDAGIQIDWLHEHPTMYWKPQNHPGLVLNESGTYQFQGGQLPLTFSLLGHRAD